MKRILISLMIAAAFAACSNPAFDPSTVADADKTQVSRVEPLSWWVGMNTPLQLLVQGENISEYAVSIEGGKGVKVAAVEPVDPTKYAAKPIWRQQGDKLHLDLDANSFAYRIIAE